MTIKDKARAAAEKYANKICDDRDLPRPHTDQIVYKLVRPYLEQTYIQATKDLLAELAEVEIALQKAQDPTTRWGWWINDFGKPALAKLQKLKQEVEIG